MSVVTSHEPTSLRQELGKVMAFLHRDLLVTLSYRTGLISDWVNLAAQVVIFGYVSKLINPSALPTYGGSEASYVSYVAIGIAVSGFMQVGIGRLMTAVRAEQLMGTLESLLVTPTHSTTLLLGSVAYDLVYVPIRTFLFLALVAVVLGVEFATGGMLPALLILAVFIPFVWGLGAATAATVLTFRRGAGAVGVATFLLTVTSGAYFPVDLFPSWVATLAMLNPLTIALEGMRECLLGGEGWSEAFKVCAILLPFTLASLIGGAAAFRAAMRRERRLGSLGIY
jgi:ABC-2 type transport system permease protein